MKVLICGDRNWTDEETIKAYIRTLPPDSVVINGRCRGADSIARFAAKEYGYEVEDYPAAWEKQGRAAGPIRNKKMLDKGKPEIVIAFHDDLEHSKGTKDMIRQARAAGIPVEVRSSNKSSDKNE